MDGRKKKGLVRRVFMNKTLIFFFIQDGHYLLYICNLFPLLYYDVQVPYVSVDIDELFPIPDEIEWINRKSVTRL
jgi:hypothetical protein